MNDTTDTAKRATEIMDDMEGVSLPANWAALVWNAEKRDFVLMIPDAPPEAVLPEHIVCLVGFYLRYQSDQEFRDEMRSFLLEKRREAS